MTDDQLSPTETDALLETVIAQLEEKTLDKDDRRLLAQMIDGLGDKRGMVRLSFAEALGQVGQPAVPLLLDALGNHEDVVVRRAAGKTLTIISDPIAVPHLICALLNDPDTVVKGSVIGALAKTGKASVPALLDILASPDYPETAKGHAAWALSFIGMAAKEELYQAIDSPVPEIRCAVVGAISNFAEEEPDDRAFTIVINALKDSTSIVRCEAAATIGKLAYQPALTNLIELLQHEDGDSRKTAAFALMKLAMGEAISPLQTALTKETEERVKKAIVLAISQLERDEDW
jgi:bilin biosynthesis protein